MTTQPPRIAVALLTEIKRNAGAIVHACAAIKDGHQFVTYPRPNEAAGENLIHVDAADQAEQLQAVVSLLGAIATQSLNPIWDVQVLVCTNDKSEVSRKNVNRVLQAFLNAQREDIPAEGRNATYRPGDKVICLRNTEVSVWDQLDGDSCRGVPPWSVEQYHKTQSLCYVANGDMGRVLAVDPKNAVVKFATPDRIVKVPTVKAKKADDDSGGDSPGKAEFDLAYGVTIHKFQGSEVPVAIIVLDEAAGPLGCRELLYTAISRATRLCFLVGKLGTAFKWAARANLTKRKTFLAEMLRATT